MKPGEKAVNTLLRNEASCLFFFKPPIRSRSPLLTGSRLISLPLATQMFQFAKFEKSKERRLATELGYGFPIGDPWITDALSPHGLSPLKASFLLNARASIQCILFDLVPYVGLLRIGYTSGTLNTNPILIQKRKNSNYENDKQLHQLRGDRIGSLVPSGSSSYSLSYD